MRLALLAFMALAACAPVAPPAAVRVVEPPLSYPPSAADRVLRIALAEWHDWGEVTRQAWGPAVQEPPRETAIENFPRVMAYWRAVENDEGAIRANRPVYALALAGTPATDNPLWSEPAWSAAFISYVFRSAGLDQREFPPNAAHSLYLDALTADARRYPGSAPFIPRDPASYAPRPGDLVCLDRSRAPLRHWSERQAEIGVPRPMHCDIVTTISPGVIEVVGGNVADAVTKTLYPADPGGLLLPAPPGRLPVLVVMESRLGRLPPWTSRTEASLR